MNRQFIYAVILCFSLSYNTFLRGQNCIDENPDECDIPEQCYQFPLPHKFSIGPEIYHLQRIREGGTKQDGWMYGLKVSYEMIKRYCFYFGIEGLYAKGNLKGHTGFDDRLKSSFTDQSIEARFGYTFQGKCFLQPAFTPFVGYGYLKETNKFHDPSPMLLKFITTYRFIAYGFLSGVAPNDQLNIGFNFKSWTPIHARTKVTDDPEMDEDISMLMGERFNYRIELPVFYRFLPCNDHLEVGLVPFYELRHYGKRENFPFDYFDTKLRMWGINVQLTYRI